MGRMGFVQHHKAGLIGILPPEGFTMFRRLEGMSCHVFQRWDRHQSQSKPPQSKSCIKMYKVVPFMIRTVEVPAAVMLYFKSQPKKVWNVKRYKEICTHIYIYMYTYSI